MPTNYETILGTLASGEFMPLLQADRRRHVYLIGMTGTGKTGLLLNMMHADLEQSPSGMNRNSSPLPVRL